MRNLISRFGLALVGMAFTALTAQAQWTLSSTLTYAGRQTGEVWAAPSANGFTPIMARKVSLGALSNQPFTNAPFALPNLDDGATYYVFAWRDSNANGVPDPTEAQAWHPGGSFLMASNRTVAGFVITDPDLDADRLPDWWEVKYGLNNRMGSGRSGALLVHGTNFTDTVKASVVGSNPAGGTTLNVSTTNGFASNDLVMIITMQDTNLNLAQNGAGVYENGRIASVAQGGGVTNLVLTAQRTNTFTPGTAQKIQVLKVPEYTELTLASSALAFDGTNDYVATPNLRSAFPTKAVTLEVWFNASGPGVIIDEAGSSPLTSAGWHDSQLEVLASGEIKARIYQLGTNSLGTVQFGTWNHAVLRYDGSTAVGFLNGVKSSGVTGNRSAPWEYGHQLYYGIGLGDNPTHLGSGAYFRGQVGDVRIWNIARTDQDIVANMHRDFTGTEPGLVAYYRMEEGAGMTASDATPNHRDGALSGPAWAPGVSGSALSFAGDDDYVDVPDGVYFNGNFTIEAWVYPRAFSIWARVLDFGINTNHILLTFCDSTGLRPHVRVGGGTYTAPGALRLNEWVHLAATVSGTTCVIYTNGVAAGSGPVQAPLVNAIRTSNKLGASSVPSEPNANVVLDEIRIWNVARSQAEIASTMGQALTGQETGLVANWSFNEGTGYRAYDATANHSDGILTGGPTWAAPATLTCQPWNGTNGGVLAFMAYQVTLGSNAMISADGKGYRGGLAVASVGDYQRGMTGERTTGFGTNNADRAADCFERAQGGGGAGRGADGSAGGGAYGSAGGDGDCAIRQTEPYTSDHGRGATGFGTVTLSRLYAGGGGGGSGSHGAGRVGVAGGAGGGVVYIAAGIVGGDGTISSRGAAGQSGALGYNLDSGAGGGGGAGGSVYLIGNLANTLPILATGGAGGLRHPTPANSKTGGAGGVGRIRLDLPPEAIAPTLDPPAGYVQHLAAAPVLWSPYADTDQDGLTDWVEYQLDTNPVNPDTDGDKLPDGWEVANGLKPLDPADAALDSDRDGLINLVEFQWQTNPSSTDTDGDGLSDYLELFVHHSNPLKADTDGDGMADGAEVAAGSDPLFAGTKYFYDAIDRLVGAQYENGLALGYEYDRNNNLVRQFYTQRDANGNGLPDLWEFLNGLTNNPSAYADTDCDGWSDYQEWQAGSNPLDPNSQPDVSGNAGAQIASTTWPFTPTNFVVGVGQLDGLGAEEIVIGADGNPGGAINFLLVLSQTTNSTWSTQRVDVGPFGVTSIAVGQPSNCPSPAIYVGVRQPASRGSVMEFVFANGLWTSNTVSRSGTNAAFVLGVRAGQDLVASQADTNGPPISACSLTRTAEGWKAMPAYSGPSQRGLGTLTSAGSHGVPVFGVQLLDAGGLQAGRYFVPPNALWNASSGRYYFMTPSPMTWDEAQTYARQCGGNLATVTDATLNSWLINNYLSAAGASGFWIGLSRSNCSAAWTWASGAPVNYTAWSSGQPDCAGGTEVVVHIWSAAGWNDYPRTVKTYGVVEVDSVVWDGNRSRLFCLTPTAVTWDNAQLYARQIGGNLATVNDSQINSFLRARFADSGIYWIGLNTCSGQWFSGAPVSYRNWNIGEPTGDGCATMVYASGTWNDCPPSSTFPGAVDLDGAPPPMLTAEPPASRRLLWRGHSLNAGNLRLTNAVSILYAFVDDKNLNDMMDAGDDFVLTEFLCSGTNLVAIGTQRSALSGSSLAQSYGLASVDALYGSQQVHFTAEPDGRVFSWSAPDATAPLQRQLFTAQHAGMAWHALASARTLEPAQSLVGLRVAPGAPNRCDVILWPPQQQLWTPAEVPQTAPVTSILPTPNQGRDLARVDVRLWDAEGSLATPLLQYRRTNSLTWSNATIAAIDGAAYGPVATSPTGLVHQVSWKAGLDLGAGFNNSVWLRARAQDVTLTGEWSAEMSYLVQNSASQPVARDDATSTFQGTWVDIAVLANDTVSVPPARIASVGLPTHGIATTNLNGTVRYTPAPGFAGTDAFVYTLADGAGALSSATVTVTVMATGPVIVLESPALLSGNQFTLVVRGQPSEVYQMQASTNLAVWSNVAFVTNVTGVVPFTNALPPNSIQYFYRALLLK